MAKMISMFLLALLGFTFVMILLTPAPVDAPVPVDWRQDYSGLPIAPTPTISHK